MTVTPDELDLLAVGDVMIDVLVSGLRRGERSHGSVEVRAGGSAVNAARAAARLGARVAVAGRVGNDPAGRLVGDELAALRIEALLAVDPEASTGSVAVVGDDAVGDRGANARFSAGDVPARASRATLVSGYLLLHDDSGAGAATALARAGLVGVDLASAALARGASVDGLEQADVLVGGEDAVCALAGGILEDALRRLARGRLLACATLGRRGTLAATRDGGLVRAEPPHVVPGDPLGAGDAFAAALVLALADDRAPDDALARACAAGAGVRSV